MRAIVAKTIVCSITKAAAMSDSGNETMSRSSLKRRAWQPPHGNKVIPFSGATSREGATVCFIHSLYLAW